MAEGGGLSDPRPSASRQSASYVRNSQPEGQGTMGFASRVSLSGGGGMASEEEHSKKAKTSNFGAYSALVTTIVGAGIVEIPKGVTMGGMAAGFGFGLFLNGVIAWRCGVALSKAMCLANEYTGRKINTFADIAEVSLGKCGYCYFSASLLFFSFFSFYFAWLKCALNPLLCAIYMLLLAVSWDRMRQNFTLLYEYGGRVPDDVMHQEGREAGPDRKLKLEVIVFALIMAVLGQIRDVSFLAKLTYISTGGIVITLLVMLASPFLLEFSGNLDTLQKPNPSWGPQELVRIGQEDACGRDSSSFDDKTCPSVSPHFPFNEKLWISSKKRLPWVSLPKKPKDDTSTSATSSDRRENFFAKTQLLSRKLDKGFAEKREGWPEEVKVNWVEAEQWFTKDAFLQHGARLRTNARNIAKLMDAKSLSGDMIDPKLGEKMYALMRRECGKGVEEAERFRVFLRMEETADAFPMSAPPMSSPEVGPRYAYQLADADKKTSGKEWMSFLKGVEDGMLGGKVLRIRRAFGAQDGDPRILAKQPKRVLAEHCSFFGKRGSAKKAKEVKEEWKDLGKHEVSNERFDRFYLQPPSSLSVYLLTILSSLTKCFFGYGYTYGIPTLQADMATPERMPAMIGWMILTVTVTYMLAALSMLLTAGGLRLLVASTIYDALDGLTKQVVFQNTAKGGGFYQNKPVPESEKTVLWLVGIFALSIFLNLIISLPMVIAASMQEFEQIVWGFFRPDRPAEGPRPHSSSDETDALLPNGGNPRKSGQGGESSSPGSTTNVLKGRTTGGGLGGGSPTSEVPTEGEEVPPELEGELQLPPYSISVPVRLFVIVLMFCICYFFADCDSSKLGSLLDLTAGVTIVPLFFAFPIVGYEVMLWKVGRKGKVFENPDFDTTRSTTVLIFHLFALTVMAVVFLYTLVKEVPKFFQNEPEWAKHLW